jgi:hypothetical protein
VLGSFLYPVYYFILFIPVWILSDPGWIKWAFLASLPITGFLAHSWYIWARKLWSMWKYQFMNLGRNKKLARLKAVREELVTLAGSLVRI